MVQKNKTCFDYHSSVQLRSDVQNIVPLFIQEVFQRKIEQSLRPKASYSTEQNLIIFGLF